MENEVKKLPSVFEYLDLFKYLQDYYRFRKAQHLGFSYDVWAAELGFQSRSYLRMVLMGKKRASDSFAERFSKAQDWSNTEDSYFLILSKYSQSTRVAEKQIYGQKLIHILKTCSDRKPVKDAIEFLSNPLHARLLVMLGFTDIAPTNSTFARLLGLTGVQINSALETLRALKLAVSEEVEGQTHWKTFQSNFDVPDNFGSVPLMHFHEVSLQDSLAAFSQPKELRRYKSLLLPLSQEEIAVFHEMTEDFTAQLFARFKADNYSTRRLFQVNLNIFSVAESNDDLASENESKNDSQKV